MDYRYKPPYQASDFFMLSTDRVLEAQRQVNTEQWGVGGTAVSSKGRPGVAANVFVGSLHAYFMCVYKHAFMCGHVG